MNRLRFVSAVVLCSAILVLVPVARIHALPVADPFTGHWEANMTDEGKTFPFVFDFKANGDALTGTVGLASQDRAFEIRAGKIKGNNISFTGFGIWTGTLNGGELNLTRELDGGKKQTMKAHRKSGS